jgi:hypothetical protein
MKFSFPIKSSKNIISATQTLKNINLLIFISLQVYIKFAPTQHTKAQNLTQREFSHLKLNPHLVKAFTVRLEALETRHK